MAVKHQKNESNRTSEIGENHAGNNDGIPPSQQMREFVVEEVLAAQSSKRQGQLKVTSTQPSEKTEVELTSFSGKIQSVNPNSVSASQSTELYSSLVFDPDETKAFKKEKLPKTNEDAASFSVRKPRRLTLLLTAAVLLAAAIIIIWLCRGRFDSDNLVLSVGTTTVAQEEYVFDMDSGQLFASVGQGLALATNNGLELMNENGEIVVNHLFQMEVPAIAVCEDFAVFYDLGGMNMAVAGLDGSLQEMTAPGNIFSVTVSSGGMIAVTTQTAGYRGLVTVYDSSLEEIYQWYSSSAWVISATVSPDSKKLAVLSYTSAGSEVRFFNLGQTEQLTAFSVSDIILLDVFWFTSSQLCGYSSEEAFFFNTDGQWLNTYNFDGQYLSGCTFSGDGFVTFSLSPYRAGTTSSLVSLDAGGKILGTADVQSEIVSLTASGSEVLVLCPDSAILYSSSLSLKGELTGLLGFKYGYLRSRSEAVLIASSYAEVYNF